MLQINNSVLEFLEEAKKAFERTAELHTYRNKDESYIALRYGVNQDCIRIYELGDSVFQLNQAIPPSGHIEVEENKNIDVFLDDVFPIKKPKIEAKDSVLARSKILKRHDN